MNKAFRRLDPKHLNRAAAAVNGATLAVCALIVEGRPILWVNGALAVILFQLWSRLDHRIDDFLREKPRALPFVLEPEPFERAVLPAHAVFLCGALAVSALLIRQDGRPWVFSFRPTAAAAAALLFGAWLAVGLWKAVFGLSEGPFCLIHGHPLRLDDAGLRAGPRELAYGALERARLHVKEVPMRGSVENRRYLCLSLHAPPQTWEIDLERYAVADAFFLVRTLRAKAPQARWQDELGAGEDFARFARLAEGEI